ncbi:hypothetical protein TRVL_02892 [Trypanosoma vivax]|nr:hypothetical protein TRVL_02892 [Trypanosoma vivax]
MSIRSINIMLKTQTKPRPYQIDAVDAAVSDGFLRSGCIVLPCGAGKTLVGIMLLCKVKKPTLILCAGSVSVEQWKNQILEFSTLGCSLGNDENRSSSGSGTASGRQRTRIEGVARISCLTAKQKDDITDDTDIVLTTYNMLVTAHKAQARYHAEHCKVAVDTQRKRGRRSNPKERLFQPYGLLIMDEVHVMPAETYKESLGFINAKGVIGLTATYVREDAKIRDLFHLVGPKLFDVSWETLASSGYLANVTCVEILTPLTRQFSLEYMERSSSDSTGAHRRIPLLVMLAAANPNKMLCVMELIRRHLAESSKILVFCDHIALLKEYSKVLNAPVICGETPHRERLMIFSDFQSTSKVNVICISRVGDVSVNLPSANVVVQVSSHGGSRRQEAQRLGRILRPKAVASNGRATDAWFYTVISTDTLEMVYAAHRTAFLVDQGYTCRVMEFDPNDESSALDTTASDAATGAISEAKEEMGDVASIKQEKLRNFFSQSKLRRDTATPVLMGSIDVRSLDYQLDLLSRVVSSWELEYHGQMQQRGEADDVKPDMLLEHQEDTVGQVDDDPLAIKRELAARGTGSYVRVTHNPKPLQDLVGVNDDFIYHEL